MSLFCACSFLRKINERGTFTSGPISQLCRDKLDRGGDRDA